MLKDGGFYICDSGIFHSLSIRAQISHGVQSAKASQRERPHLHPRCRRDDILYLRVSAGKVSLRLVPFPFHLSNSRLSNGLVLLLTFPHRRSSFLSLFRLPQGGSNWRKPRRSTLRELLWRIVRLLPPFPALSAGRGWRVERGTSQKWRSAVEKKINFQARRFFIGSDRCRRAAWKPNNDVRGKFFENTFALSIEREALTPSRRINGNFDFDIAAARRMFN